MEGKIMGYVLFAVLLVWLVGVAGGMWMMCNKEKQEQFLKWVNSL
jgi:ABC-type Na+ efflux pump permease subunit